MKKKLNKKSGRKTVKAKKGMKYVCDECGMTVIVDKLGNNSDICDISCCGSDMELVSSCAVC